MNVYVCVCVYIYVRVCVYIYTQALTHRHLPIYLFIYLYEIQERDLSSIIRSWIERLEFTFSFFQGFFNQIWLLFH